MSTLSLRSLQNSRELPPIPDTGFHRRYRCTSEGGCIHLRAGDEDGLSFCIHSVVLRRCSGFFRTTLSLPSGDMKNAESEMGIVIAVAEPAHIVEVLLDVSSGHSFNIETIPTVNDILDVLHAAEKYEMGGVVSMVRYAVLGLRSPFQGHPLQFALACHRFDWSDEYRVALQRTLSLDISAPHIFPQLCTLDGVVLAHIHKLRFLRTKRFKELLFATADDLCDTNAEREFDSGINSECMARRSLVFQQWKWMVVEEFTTFPSGHTLLRDSFHSRPAVVALFGPYGCRHSSFRSHELGLAKLSWTSMLRRVLDEVASSYSLDLRACVWAPRQRVLADTPVPIIATVFGAPVEQEAVAVHEDFLQGEIFQEEMFDA